MTTLFREENAKIVLSTIIDEEGVPHKLQFEYWHSEKFAAKLEAVMQAR